MTEQQTSGRDRTEEGPQPQPEHDEPRLADPTPGDLSKHDFLAILVRAGKDSLKDRHHEPRGGAGVLRLPCDSRADARCGRDLRPGRRRGRGHGDHPATRRSRAAGGADAARRQPPNRVTESQSSSGLAMIIVGSVLALWTLTGSMETLMWSLNSAYDREETRGFVKRRLTALAMVFLMLLRVRARLRPARPRAAPLGLDRRRRRDGVVRGVAVVDCPVADPAPRPPVRVRHDLLPRAERRPSPLDAS